MNRILVTHNDFDGVACAVLFKSVWPNEQIFFENYKTVNGRLRQVLKDYPETEIYITDISPENDQELIDQLNNRAVWLFDHHKTALPLTGFPWATVDTSMCGAMLFWRWLVAYNSRDIAARVRAYNALVWHVNDYDTWKHENPMSAKLNKLLCALGRERFMKRFFKNPDPILTNLEIILLELEQERENRYIQEVMDRGIIPHLDGEGRPYTVVFAEQYTSQLGHAILARYPMFNYVVIVNFLHGTVSLRSQEGGVDVSEIARRYGGGGHPGAAGFSLPERYPDFGWFS